MKPSKQQVEKIEAALIEAHRRQEEVKLPPGWRPRLLRDISALAGPAAFPREKRLTRLIPRRIGALAAAALAVLVGWLVVANLDWYDPWITLKPDLTTLGGQSAFWLEAGDVDSGLRNVKVTVIQQEMKVEALSKNLEPAGGIWGGQEAVKQVNLPLTLDPEKLGLHYGKATIIVTVRDLSWRNGFKGRITTLKKEIVFHSPPSP